MLAISLEVMMLVASHLSAIFSCLPTVYYKNPELCIHSALLSLAMIEKIYVA
jgi:hypothetical protein